MIARGVTDETLDTIQKCGINRFCDTFHPHLVCLSQMGTFVATTTAKIQRKNCRAAKTVVPLHRQKEQTTFQ